MRKLNPVQLGDTTWQRTEITGVEWREIQGHSPLQELPMYRNRPPTSCPILYIPETGVRIVYHNPITNLKEV